MENNANRCDIVRITIGQFNLSYKLIFNGKNAIELDYSTYDSSICGAINIEFRIIDEYPIDYWNNVIYKNNYFWYFGEISKETGIIMKAWGLMFLRKEVNH